MKSHINTTSQKGMKGEQRTFSVRDVNTTLKTGEVVEQQTMNGATTMTGKTAGAAASKK